MLNFGRTVNQVVIPELSEQIILATVAKAEQEYKEKEMAERMTAMDFYYNVNMDKHIEQYFSSESLQQIPTFPQKVVPRFSRARMMLYKQPPKRIIGGEENDDYKEKYKGLEKWFSASSAGSCYKNHMFKVTEAPQKEMEARIAELEEEKQLIY